MRRFHHHPVLLGRAALCCALPTPFGDIVLLWVGFLAFFRDFYSAHRVAVGVSIGMVLGLMPKENLTFVAIGLMLIALPVNITSGFCSMILFSWVSSLTDPIADGFGQSVLRFEIVRQVLGSFYEIPFGAWTGLDNTVVVGNLILGLMLCPPVYLFTVYFIRHCQPVIAVQIRQFYGRWFSKTVRRSAA